MSGAKKRRLTRLWTEVRQGGPKSGFWAGSIQKNSTKGFVNFQIAIITDHSQFPELIHKKTYS